MVSFSAGQEAARRLLEGPQRYTCLAGGTRSGKTFLIVRMIMIRALEAKESAMLYCATTPTRRGLPSRSARFLRSCNSVSRDAA